MVKGNADDKKKKKEEDSNNMVVKNSGNDDRGPKGNRKKTMQKAIRKYF